MSKILTKKIQTQLSHYFLRGTTLTKPETRCLKDMVFGVLKSKYVFVNQIAASLREPLKLKDDFKRFSAQYLKDDYADKMSSAKMRLCYTLRGIIKPGITFLYHYQQYVQLAKEPYSYTQFLEHYRRRYASKKGSTKLDIWLGKRCL